ncbi:MAG: tryptophan--tRNA ligase [Alphaproteobacteria bacterium GM7ARS4]|nr:tryptophan--tRNA ligase [Alphaproteobacteria bacterium GM7ARS4]
MTESPKRIFSGIQPTGVLHIGNYFGALRNWVAMQDEGECLFCVVDLHALTSAQTRQGLREGVRCVTAAYLAAGLDVEKSIIFHQSAVPKHAALQWLLSCFTPLGWLNRMTQFKDKAGKKRESAMLGLYAYPVLMAADILLYRATHVPVGDDQRQHLELARDIAERFNHECGEAFFPLPEPRIMEEASRIMSLRDGTNKMSKSEASDYGRINVLDTDDTICLKIQKARTDSHPLPSCVEEMEGRAEAKNLLTLYAVASHQTLQQACAMWAGKPFSSLKPALSERLIEVVAPMRDAMHRHLSDPDKLDAILHHGAARASRHADETWNALHDIVGFL